jgi:hypothetical protein
MKKFLSKILVLFFVWNSNSFAEQLFCKIEKAYKCNSGDCVEFNSETNLNSMSAPKDYNLSRSQFAKELGITRENLKQRMRRGQYKDY